MQWCGYTATLCSLLLSLSNLPDDRWLIVSINKLTSLCWFHYRTCHRRFRDRSRYGRGEREALQWHSTLSTSRGEVMMFGTFVKRLLVTRLLVPFLPLYNCLLSSTRYQTRNCRNVSTIAVPVAGLLTYAGYPCGRIVQLPLHTYTVLMLRQAALWL